MATKTQTSTKVAPLADRVVVKALEATEQLRGGHFIPDTAND
jgi:chaperonin GroES